MSSFILLSFVTLNLLIALGTGMCLNSCLKSLNTCSANTDTWGTTTISPFLCSDVEIQRGQRVHGRAGIGLLIAQFHDHS